VKKTCLSIAAAAVISIAGGTAGFAAELPAYQAAGLPISAVQAQVGSRECRGTADGGKVCGLAASAERPDTADQTDDRDRRTSPDRNRSLRSLTGIMAV